MMEIDSSPDSTKSVDVQILLNIKDNKSNLSPMINYFEKYDGEISTHEYKYKIVKLLKAVEEKFPNWNLFGKQFTIDQSKQFIHECDMKLYSFYNIEQHKNSTFGKMLSAKTRVYIIRDAKDQYDLTLQIYESAEGATTEVFLLHRITHYGIDNSKYYFLKKTD
jgi:hypothetical protein